MRDKSMDNEQQQHLMRAVHYVKYGGGDEGLKHVEVMIPKAKKGQMLVKIEAISLNPVDWKIQRGLLRPLIPSKFPYVPCSDISGEVVQIGKGVSNFSVGDKVLSWLDLRKGGGMGEYAIAETRFTVKREKNVSSMEAAALPIAGLTALQSLRDSGHVTLQPNESASPLKILVTAASGGVGSYAVQLAKLGGAHVVATCGSRNLELVKNLGADEVIDYKVNNLDAYASKFDVIIHCASAAELPLACLASKGVLVDITPNFKNIVKSIFKAITFSKKQLIPFYMIPKASDLQFLMNNVKDGNLKSIIDSVYNLSKVEEAWQKIMEGHATGKVLVVPDSQI